MPSTIFGAAAGSGDADEKTGPFFSEMQGDVTQLLGLPGSSGEEEHRRLPSYKPADLRRWKYGPLPRVVGGSQSLGMSVDL